MLALAQKTRCVGLRQIQTLDILLYQMLKATVAAARRSITWAVNEANGEEYQNAKSDRMAGRGCGRD